MTCTLDQHQGRGTCDPKKCGVQNCDDGRMYLDYYLGKVLHTLAWIGLVSFCAACVVAVWSLK